MTVSSQQASSQPSSGRTKVLAWGVLSVVIGVAVAGFVGRMAPRFGVLYSPFGDFLLAPTRVVLSWWYVLWVVPVIALVVVVVAMRQPDVAHAQRRTVILLMALSAMAIVLGVLATLALYAPMFVMGQPV